MPLPTGASSLRLTAFGPFTAGVIDTANSGAPPASAARTLRNALFTGAGRLTVRPGYGVACTLVDDQLTPALVSSVCAIAPFASEALAVAWSATTQKCYLYRLAADFGGWYDASGAFHATQTAAPVGVLWTGMATAPGVLLAEGLGVAYVTCTEAASPTGLRYPLRTFTAPGTFATPTADLDGSGTPQSLYPTGCVSFQQHLWLWGAGAGATVATAYRPELARFSAINFGADGGALFAAGDSLTLGDRVRSVRERVVGAGLAGDALYLGGPSLLTRVVGYGRQTWTKTPVDRSFGFTSPWGQATAGDVCYFWSPRGPARVGADGVVEPLWDAVAGLVAQVQRPNAVRAVFDATRDLVVWTVDVGGGARTWCGYDVRRGVFVGPDNDWARPMGAVALVEPLPPALAATAPPAPTALATAPVGLTTATAAWALPDPAATPVLQVRVQGATAWLDIGTLAVGSTAYTFGGLSPDTAYEWRVAARRFGITSDYTGPVAPDPANGRTGSQFVTQPSGTSAPIAPSQLAVDVPAGTTRTLRATWTPAGEASVSTEVQLAGPANDPPDSAAYASVRTALPGTASALLRVGAAGFYWVRIRALSAVGPVSGFVGPVAQYVPATVDKGDGSQEIV